MKIKILNLLLIIASLFGYLEWGGNNHSFLFENEYTVLSKLFIEPKAVLHPLTLIPILGQILLLVTLFQQKPNKYLTYIGIGCLGLLLGLMTFIGIIDFNFRILISTVPFIVLSVWIIQELRKGSNPANSQILTKNE